MSRNAFAVAIALTLLIGVVIGQLTAVGSPEQESRVRTSERRLELVRTFYAGMNDYLANENRDFESLLAPGFQDMGTLATEPGSVETLVARLDALRDSIVAPAFAIEEIHDLGQVIQVRVSTGLPEQLEAGGFTIRGFEAVGALEFLQVEGDAIVARWGQDDRIPRIESRLSDSSPAGVPRSLVVESQLVTLEPGVEWLPTSAVLSWLIVERGSVVLDSGAEMERMTTGDALSAPRGIRRIANRAAEASSFWLVSIVHDVSANTLTVGPDPPGVTIVERASSSFFGLPADFDRVRIELARIVISPGVNLDQREGALGHQLIVIDGAVQAVVHRGELLHVTAAALIKSERENVSISAGNAAVSRPGAAVSYRSSAPDGATLLLVTIGLAE